MAERFLDGAYVNGITGAGLKMSDKSAHTRAEVYTPADLKELANMVVGDGVADRIVSFVPETAFENDFTITGDSDGSIFKECSDSGLIEALQEAGECQRLTGGAIVVTEYDELGDNLMNEPMDKAGITGYRVYSAGSVELDRNDFVGDNPRFFRIRRIDSETVDINPSRVTVFKGKKLPDVLRGSSIRETFFGTSALKPCEKSLKDLADIMTSGVNMAMENGLSVFNFDGFEQIFHGEDCGASKISQMMSIIKLSMSTMRAVLLGSKDKVEFKSHNFAGMPELMQKYINQVCADSGFPVSILFGQSATGLAQTNKADVDAFCGLAEKWRSRYMYKPSCRLVKDLARRNKSKDASEFTWGPTTAMSVLEKIDAFYKQAQGIKIYHDVGSITPDEIRENVFVNGHSWDISVKK